jgi:uncharacterized protein with HEPN domain
VRDDGVYLQYIRENLELIQQHVGAVAGHSERDRFYTDFLTQAAVLRWLETVTDAAGHLSRELRDRHAEIDWVPLTGFWNVLAHAYLSLNLDLIWQAIVEDLPALRAVVEAETG